MIDSKTLTPLVDKAIIYEGQMIIPTQLRSFPRLRASFGYLVIADHNPDFMVINNELFSTVDKAIAAAKPIAESESRRNGMENARKSVPEPSVSQNLFGATLQHHSKYRILHSLINLTFFWALQPLHRFHEML